MASHDALLQGTSDRFRLLHAEIGLRIDAAFDDVEAVEAFGMPAFMVPLRDPPPEEEWRGTIPRTHITIAPTQKRAGITLHVWHPKAPHLLRDNEGWLREAGFKVMVGCLQWNRKAELPLDAVDRLIETIREA